MKATNEDLDVAESRAFHLCRRGNHPSRCLGRDWYETALDCIAELDEHAARHGDLSAAFAPWCELHEAIGDGLDHALNATRDDNSDFFNAGPTAKRLLRNLHRRFG